MMSTAPQLKISSNIGTRNQMNVFMNFLTKNHQLYINFLLNSVNSEKRVIVSAQPGHTGDITAV